MRQTAPILLASLLFACGGSSPPPPANDPSGSDASTAAETGTAGNEPSEATSPSGDDEFELKDSETAGSAHGATESKIKATKTEAAMKFFVVDKKKGPLEGIVISLTGPDSKRYYTPETDSQGYAEVLVPVGARYNLVYLTLGREDISASVTVSDEPNQNIKLTLRYENKIPPPAKPDMPEPGFVLDGITFDSGKASIRPESYPRLDRVVEYMTYKKSTRIEISGHTDNVGSKQANKDLSEKRARACRDYLIAKGIDGSRIEALGFGDERPIANNGSAEGREKNRRIEAKEL